MNTFKETGLREEILAAVEGLGFESPTPVQEKSIAHLMSSSRDLMAFAQTGTGKTAAFSLPLLHHTDLSSMKTQALILCPTRELCLQICKGIEDFSSKLKGFRVSAVYGGASIENQIKSLQRGCQFVVGTPGRTLDLIRRKKLELSNIRWVVLDEADEMLSMGFKEDLNEILASTPEEKQSLLFSATMPNEIKVLTKNYMKDPEEITIGRTNVTNENVSHYYYVAQQRDRYLALKRIADINPNIYGIVFCRTRREAKDIAEKLSKDGYNADALHGDLSQSQRDHIMLRFRNKNIQLLIATDVAARGLDVDNLTHVINFALPDDNDVYMHRSGRTGRAERKGEALSIVHAGEIGRIRYLESKLGKKIEMKKIPSGREICETQLLRLIDKVENVEVNQETIADFLPAIYEKLNDLSREELIQHFVSVEFNKYLSYYKNARDINVDPKELSKPRFGDRYDRRRGDRNNGKFSRFFINIGSNNNLTPKTLMGLINEHVPQRGLEIGKIDILKNFSFFEVEEPRKGMIPESFKQVNYRGTKVFVEHSNKEKRGGGGGGRRDFDRKRGGGFNRRSEGGDRSFRGGRDGGDYRKGRSDRYDRKDRYDRSERRDRSATGYKNSAYK